MYVQPRARGTLLPLSLPEASVLRGHAELRGDWDLGCCDGRHREFAGTGDGQGHRRVTRQVFFFIFISIGKLKEVKHWVLGGLFLCPQSGLSDN